MHAFVRLTILTAVFTFCADSLCAEIVIGSKRDAVLAEFPFVPDDPAIPVGTLGARSASRSVALSSILTAVSRRTMRNAPMHAYDAPEASSGDFSLPRLRLGQPAARPARRASKR